jgi:hypothetical protein
MLSLYKLFHRYYLINMNRNSAAASSAASNSNSRSAAPAMPPSSPPRSSGARGSADPAPSAAVARSRSRRRRQPGAAAARGSDHSAAAAAGSRRVVFTNFPEGHDPMSPIDDPGPGLVNAVRQTLFEHEESRAIVGVTWWVRREDGVEHEFHLRTTVLELLPAARSVRPEDHVREIIRLAGESIRERLESPGVRSSKLQLLYMMKMEIDLVRGRRAQLLAPPPPAPVAPSQGSGVGRGNVVAALPEELFRRRCCLKINNSDDFCFRYCMTAWMLGVPRQHPERVPNYITNAPAGGRLPQGFRPVFKDCGSCSTSISRIRATITTCTSSPTP